MEINLDTFDVRGTLLSLLDVVKRRLWLVLLTAFLTVFVMFLYIRYFPPVYSAGVTVLLEGDTDMLRREFYDRWSIFRGGLQAETEAELLRIGPVVKEVIEQMDLKYEDVYHPFLSHVVYLWGESYVGKTYRKIKKKIFPPEESPLRLTDAEIDLAKSVKGFQAGVGTESQGGASVAEIQVLAPTKRVTQMANTLVEVFLKQRAELHTREAMAAYEVLGIQVDRAYETLSERQEALASFSKEHSISFDFAHERRMVEELAAQKTRRMATQAELKAQEGRFTEIQEQLRVVAETEVSSRSRVKSVLYKELESDLLQQEVLLISLRDRYQPDSVEIKEVEGHIGEFKEKLAELDMMVLESEAETANPVWELLRNEYSLARLSLAELKAGEAEQGRLIAEVEESLRDVPHLQAEASGLTRSYALADGEYTILVEKQRQAYISGATQIAETATLKVLDWAAVPDKPIRPKQKFYYLAAVLVGLLLGVGAAFAVDFVDDRIRGRSQLKNLSGFEVYAELPSNKDMNL